MIRSSGYKVNLRSWCTGYSLHESCQMIEASGLRTGADTVRISLR